jgi:beta-mannosidase
VAKNLHLQLMDFRGKVYKDISVPVVIGKNASGKFYAISKKDLLQGIDPGTLVFTASFGESDERANQSFLYFSAPKDLKLPVPDIVKKVSGTPEGYEIRLSSDKLVKNVYLFSTHPGDFSDNYFDMLPGKTYIVTFMTPVKNLNPGSLIEIKSLVNSY